jgi:hypothetical protein
MREFIRTLPNLLLATLVIVVEIYLSKVISRFAQQVFGHLSHVALVTSLFGSFVQIACTAATFFVALSILQLNKTLTSISRRWYYWFGLCVCVSGNHRQLYAGHLYYH